MKLRRLVGLAVVAGIFLSIVYMGFSAISSEPPYTNIILDAVALRNVKNDSVAMARYVSELDVLVGKAKQEVKTHWTRIAECLPSCEDDLYFDMIVAAAIEGTSAVPNAKLIADLVAANRFWGSEDVVEFSKALSAADAALNQMRSKLLDKQWQAIVACDGKCGEKNDLFFDLIRVVVSQGGQQ